ncbi:MAG: 4Fe-4S binding protein [Solobacterium sp.]|nr:4Fe-4S binding protein [Solobacterium sp.]
MRNDNIQPVHSSLIPYIVNPGACVACGRCRRTCPADAIIITDISAIIQENCIGCGKCESVCPANAIHKNRN